MSNRQLIMLKKRHTSPQIVYKFACGDTKQMPTVKLMRRKNGMSRNNLSSSLVFTVLIPIHSFSQFFLRNTETVNTFVTFV